MTATPLPRVLIVADNASERLGGEAILPFHYFRLLRQRGVDVRLVAHARVREELLARWPDAAGRMHFVEDSPLHRLVWRLGRRVQPRLRYFTFELVLRVATQCAQRRVARRLVEAHRIEVVHQPTPVSPREPSLLFGLGAPVVIGPMNCAVDPPPGFRDFEPASTRLLVRLGRAVAPLLDRLLPGKRRAALLLVANERSRAALVGGSGVPVALMAENGVDLAGAFVPATRPPAPAGCRFVFVGRLLRSKGVHLFVQAFELARREVPDLSATVVGDGPESDSLRSLAASFDGLAARAGEPGRIDFAGWRTQREVAALLREQDCFVFPSLFECGGAAVLEAMASGLPVIAAGWGGPADYVDPSCGLLVTAAGPEEFVEALAAAMLRLARAPAERDAMGRAGRAKVERHYAWERKIDRIVDCYRLAMGAPLAPRRPSPPSPPPPGDAA